MSDQTADAQDTGDDKKKDTRSFAERQSDIERARSELRDALNDLEDRVNPSKVANRVSAKAKSSISDDPTPWIAAAAGVVVLVAGAVTLAIFGRK